MKLRKKNMYQSADIVLEAIKSEYDKELERSVKLDNKINITLTLCGVLFLYIIKFFDFKQIINAQQGDMDIVIFRFIQIIAFLGNIVVLALYGYCLIKFIKLLGIKTYLHINSRELIDQKLYQENKSISQAFIFNRYLGAIISNAKTNGERVEKYDRHLNKLKWMIGICAILEILRINFLGLEVG